MQRLMQIRFEKHLRIRSGARCAQRGRGGGAARSRCLIRPARSLTQAERIECVVLDGPANSSGEGGGERELLLYPRAQLPETVAQNSCLLIGAQESLRQPRELALLADLRVEARG